MEPRGSCVPVWEEVLDEGLLVGCPDGSLELHVHGSPVLVQRLLDGAAGPDSIETGKV